MAKVTAGTNTTPSSWVAANVSFYGEANITISVSGSTVTATATGIKMRSPAGSAYTTYKYNLQLFQNGSSSASASSGIITLGSTSSGSSAYLPSNSGTSRSVSFTGSGSTTSAQAAITFYVYYSNGDYLTSKQATPKINQSVTLYYTVSFNSQGGTTINSQSVAPGGHASRPSTDPVRNGYTFDNWYTASSGGSVFDFSGTSINSNTTIYAQWTPITYTITYSLDGGSIVDEPTTYTAESSVSIPNPTRTNYDFAGWVGTDLSGPTSNLTLPAGSYGNRTYTATWQQNVYVLSYNATQGTSAPPSQTAEVSWGQPTPTIILSGSATWEGNYGKFNRWNTASDGSGTDYYPGDTIVMYSNVTLYAIWDYRVRIYPNGSNIVVVDSVVEDREDFDETLTYQVGDRVAYGDPTQEIYECIVAVTTPGPWTGTTNWDDTGIVDGQTIEPGVIVPIVLDSENPEFSDILPYTIGDFVSYQNDIYVCIADIDQEHVGPWTGSANWKDIDDIPPIEYPDYDSSSTYSIGDRVIQITHGHEILYVCIVDIDTPEAFDSSHWKPAAFREYIDQNYIELWKTFDVDLTIPYKIDRMGYIVAGYSTDPSASTATYPYVSDPIDDTIHYAIYNTNNYADLYATFSPMRYSVTFKDGFSTPGEDTIRVVNNISYGSPVDSRLIPHEGTRYQGDIVNNENISDITITGSYHNKYFVHPEGYSLITWIGNYEDVESDSIVVAQWDFTPVWIMTDMGNNIKMWLPYKPEENA